MKGAIVKGESVMSAQPMFAAAVAAFDVAQRVYMRLRSYLSPSAVCSTVFGAKVVCNSRDFVQRRIRFFGVFEHNLTFYTLRVLKPGDVYIDIGSNVGYFTLLAASRVGEHGKVVAVEAVRSTYDALVNNVKLNGYTNVFARHVAATADHCKVEIKSGEAHNSGSNEVVVGGGGSVDGVPFRDIVGADIGRVGFIKIDIEGSERPILEAILEALPDLPADLKIASEVSPTSSDLVRQFAAHGFKVWGLQNIYTIDYYLIRSYMTRYREGDSVQLVPLTEFHPDYRDYIFERGA